MSWKDEIKVMWEEIKEVRQSSSGVKNSELDDGEGGEIELYPYLECSYVRIKPGTLMEILQHLPNQMCTFGITVRNNGTFPTWVCHVEVRETPSNILRAHTVITLQPSESRDVNLKARTGKEGTGLIGICYDPLLDPYDPEDPSDRKWTPLAFIASEQMAQLPIDDIRQLLQPNQLQ
jgi:hypothetical protein